VSTTSTSTHLFWIISRGAGTTALILSSASVFLGLAMAGKLLKRAGPDRLPIHEVLSLSTMIAIAVHGLSLIGDTYLHPSIVDVTVPFAMGYRTLATSIGILAGWGLIFLGLSFYLRDRIGRRRWRQIHRFTLLVWVAGVVHAFTDGTDAGQAWFIALVALTSAPAVVLLARRVVHRRPWLPAATPPRRARQAGSSPSPGI
jgi:sulfoxide reductase heme-binding subunit YedZ